MGSHSQPEGSAWAAYLASPSSSAMSPMPSAEKASQWVPPSHKVSPCCLNPSMSTHVEPQCSLCALMGAQHALASCLCMPHRRARPAVQAVGTSEGLAAATSGRGMGQAAGDKPQQLQDHYRFDSASSYYNFPLGSRPATEFMPPAPITTGAVPVLSAPHAPLAPRARPWLAEAPEASSLGTPLSSGKAEMPVVCREAARTAWPAIAGSAGMAGKSSPELHQRSDSMQEQPALQGMRLSYKLGDAGPQQLAGSSLRGGVQHMLGGEATSPGLQAAVRSGCVHLVVDALTFKVRPAAAPTAFMSLFPLPVLQVLGTAP